MVAAIIEPACGPRMRVIAEGVETEASSTTSGGAAWRILNAESAMAYRRKRRPRLYLRR
jgi:hypothetical protein